MSWDGVGRRPIRDKQNENKQLRALMLGILKSHNDVFKRIPDLKLSKDLLDAFIEARRLDGNFKARRRIERHIVNLLRVADPEEHNQLEQLLHEPERYQQAHEETILKLVQSLINDSDALSEFIEKRPGLEVQHLRVLIRNAKKSQNTSKTAPMTKLKAYLREWID